MKNVALTIAAILVATSSAFAGSHHHRPHANQTAATVDSTYTASVRKPDMVRQGVQAPMKSAADELDRSIWGN